MIGYSNEFKTQIIYGKGALDEWLQQRKVIVIDIKYAVTESSSDKFLVIYKNIE